MVLSIKVYGFVIEKIKQLIKFWWRNESWRVESCFINEKCESFVFLPKLRQLILIVDQIRKVG